MGGRRQSQAPRLSIAMAGTAEEGERRNSMRQFCCMHMKSLVTVAMMFGMLLCIILIVVGECVRARARVFAGVCVCVCVCVCGVVLCAVAAAAGRRSEAAAARSARSDQ